MNEPRDRNFGMTQDAKGVCPICGRVFLTFRRPGDPEHVIQPRTGPRKTCRRIECMDAETLRVLRPAMNQIWARIDAARTAENEKADRKRQKGLQRLGDLS